jgi:hypothetical protein
LAKETARMATRTMRVASMVVVEVDGFEVFEIFQIMKELWTRDCCEFADCKIF